MKSRAMASAQRARKQPRQSRSRQTEARMLAATESLLAEREFETLSIDEIVARAHTSVGAFYKRFGSKRELLKALLGQLQTQLNENAPKELPTQLSLSERIAAVIDANARAYVQRRHLVRACVAAHLKAELKLNADERARARAQQRTLEQWFLGRREEIAHPQPEVAVRMGFYLTLQSLQMSLLLGERPADLSVEDITAEAKRMLTCYLMGSGPQPSAPAVQGS
jgi:AcrR family transcriptional regulator